jgi:flavodoxin
MLVDEILEEMKKSDIEDVLKKYDWKDFESFVEFVFQQHDFETKRNFWFKTNRRYEIDVVAEREVIMCVDCKRWCGGRYKKSSLIKAGEAHAERVKEFKNFIKSSKMVIPVIITLMDEDITRGGEVFIIPVWKLNEFVLNFYSF